METAGVATGIAGVATGMAGVGTGMAGITAVASTVSLAVLKNSSRRLLLSHF